MTRRTALLLAAAAARGAGGKRMEIRGMYSSPQAFWDKGARLDGHGVNALFVGGASITARMVERARGEGARVFAEFPTLNGKGYVEQHPEAWPVNEKGEKAAAATWFLGACPSEPGFRAFRRQQLEDLLGRVEIAGVWMDYFHWHAQFEDPHPVLPETCFCPACLEAFAQASGIRAPAPQILAKHERAWREWRVAQLLTWARMVRETVRRLRPQALVGVFHCPWTNEEFAGARRRILGLDLDALAGVVDVFSPMVYHGRMGRRAEWVGEYVEWLSRAVAGRARIWPIVQAHNDPRAIPAEEFERVLRFGAAGASTGVMMFTARSVAEDPAKLAAMRRVYREWSGAGA